MQDAQVAAPDHLDRLRQTYEEVHPRLWRAVLAWSGSADVADEAVADAFAQAARRGDDLRDPAAWVWRAAFRIAAGELARRRRSPVVSLDDPDRPIGWDPPQVRPGTPDDAVALIAALQHLSDQQRRAVVLVDGAGFTAPEAADLLATSPATIRVQLVRARRRLRALLSDDATTQETTDAP
jgi:RNA polymerase sigma-70 factor (ECF subfamily)